MDKWLMNIWAVQLKTPHQSNTKCFNDQEKAEKYANKCSKGCKIEWLAVDFAVVDDKNNKRIGKINRRGVY